MRILLALLLAGCSVGTAGQSFLGARYISSPLGEGVAPDDDPLIRYDAFDCTTFVETVLADGDLKKLNKIRYKNGEIDFLNRNHFIESDWLMNNADLVQNVSNKYGKTSVRNVRIDKTSWLKKELEKYINEISLGVETMQEQSNNKIESVERREVIKSCLDNFEEKGYVKRLEKLKENYN